MTDIIKQQSGV